MTAPDQSRSQNRLLALMPADAFAALAPHLCVLETPRGFVVGRAGEEIESILLPEKGVGSAIAISREGHKAEAGMYGRDGFAPVAPLLGADTAPNDSQMQVGGWGWAVETGAFLQVAEAFPEFRRLLLRYVQCLSVQNSLTALSNAMHPIEERLARWILMCDDRTDGGEVALTHEYLSVMLAVRRPSVTTALHGLEGAGFIRAERGLILVRNRQGLADFARDAYGKAEEEYQRLIGPMRPPPQGGV